MAEAAANCWHHCWLQNVFAKPCRGEAVWLYSLMAGFFAKKQTCIERTSFIFSPAPPCALNKVRVSANRDGNFYSLLHPVLLLETLRWWLRHLLPPITVLRAHGHRNSGKCRWLTSATYVLEKQMTVGAKCFESIITCQTLLPVLF